MKEMDYKKAFEWVCEQIKDELSYTKEEICELQSSGDTWFHRLVGMRFAYESIEELCDNINKYGVDEYERICGDTCKKYEES